MNKEDHDGTSEDEHLLELWNRNICPTCGSSIPEGTRVGSGRRREGGFCSLDCYAKYRIDDVVDRARRTAAMVEKISKSRGRHS